MIVTEEGKNIYPEDIENSFEGLPLKEFCVFAANYVWPARTMLGEKLVLIIHLEPGKADALPDLLAAIAQRNSRLLGTNASAAISLWDRDFPADGGVFETQAQRAGQADSAGRKPRRQCIPCELISCARFTRSASAP